MTDDLRERVKEERKLRSLSVRRAAQAGGCSNTIWGDWENGKTADVGDTLRAAVVTAFGWPADWPEHPPPSRVRPDDPATPVGPTNAQLLEVLEELVGAVVDTQAMLRAIARARGIPLPPGRSGRAPSPRALNAGRRKADRL